MGVSTVTASRIYSVGVDGKLTMDWFPFTALSKTYTTDHITPDSAGTMTAMMTGVNTNQGLIGFGPETECNDFNGDGDGEPLVTFLEIAKEMGKKVGVVSTACVTHATPAACYAHVNERNKENDIALQALPTDATFNKRLGDGLDLLMGGGRRYFTPSGMLDEEGETGSRPDGRDLRREFQDAGYTYVWNEDQFDGLTRKDTLIIVTADHSHVFNIAGCPLRPIGDLPYDVNSAPAEYENPGHGDHDGILDVVYDIGTSSGDVSVMTDADGVPYTILSYANGPGHRDGARIDPRIDAPASTDPQYLQEALVKLGSVTHSGEDVTIYAIGPDSLKVHGTVKNTFIFDVMKDAVSH